MSTKMGSLKIVCVQLGPQKPSVIGASLSEPHTSVTALLDACVCMFVCGHIPKI